MEGKVKSSTGRGKAQGGGMDCLDFMALGTSHIPDTGQVAERYCGIYANAHRGKLQKVPLFAPPLPIVEELRHLLDKGWSKMIRKSCALNPLTFLRGGSNMKVISFLTDFSIINRVIDHLT